MQAWKSLVGNGTLRMAVKVAVPIFLAGSLWGTLWAKVSHLEGEMTKGFDRLYGLFECLVKTQ